MMQFNLLPDVKLEYVRTRRMQRLAVAGSILLSAVTLGVFLFMLFFVHIVQTKNIRDLDADIKTDSSKITAIPDINKILTVQNQLNSLPAIYDQRPAAPRLFDYLKQLTPGDASLTQVNADFTAQTLSMNGTAPALDTVNKFVDTLKFTTYSTQDDPTVKTKVFSNVVLSSFGLSEKNASFTIDATFDPAIFDSTKQITMSVPATVTTRSQINQPSALFQTQDTKKQ